MRLSKNTYTALILTVTGLVRILQLKESVLNILLNGRGAVLNLCEKELSGCCSYSKRKRSLRLVKHSYGILFCLDLFSFILRLLFR